MSSPVRTPLRPTDCPQTSPDRLPPFLTSLSHPSGLQRPAGHKAGPLGQHWVSAGHISPSTGVSWGAGLSVLKRGAGSPCNCVPSCTPAPLQQIFPNNYKPVPLTEISSHFSSAETPKRLQNKSTAQHLSTWGVRQLARDRPRSLCL